MARLGDLFLHIRNGANIKQGLDNTGYPITRIETISNRVVNREKMGYAGITDVNKYAEFVLQDGDILMSHINSEIHLGKVALYEKEDDEIIIHGMNLLLLRPNKDLITSKYAFYYLSSQSFLRQIPNITKKSVNQASFTVSALKELVFPITSIEEQKKITLDLDKVNGLIFLRKKQLSKLDELVKSRFIEMFGEINAPSKWDKKPWAELVTIQNGRDYKHIVVESGGYAVYGTGGEMARASDYLCPENTIIVGRKGTINNPLLVKEKIWNVDTAFGVIVGEQLHYQYFYGFCKMFDFSALNKQAVLPSTTKADLLKIQMAVPPIEIQRQFAVFVEQVDKSKFEIQKSLEKLEILKKALMQKYFG